MENGNPYSPPKATIPAEADTSVLRKTLVAASVLQVLGLMHDASRLYDMWRMGALHVLVLGLLLLAAFSLLAGGILLAKQHRLAKSLFGIATILGALVLLGESSNFPQMLHYAFSLYRMLWIVPGLALISWVMSYKVLSAKINATPATTGG